MSSRQHAKAILFRFCRVVFESPYKIHAVQFVHGKKLSQKEIIDVQLYLINLAADTERRGIPNQYNVIYSNE